MSTTSPNFTAGIPPNLTPTSNPLLFLQWRIHLLEAARTHDGTELRRLRRESAINANALSQLVWELVPLLDQADAERGKMVRELRESRWGRRERERERREAEVLRGQLDERGRELGDRGREIEGLRRQLRERRERCVRRRRKGQKGGGRATAMETLASTRGRRSNAKY
ncbi:hypothetical protein MMC30_004205 [Trapelia coarctata]|nr:hypothetical protein [Trapelia coarctata]